jgi:single-stranded-DNA-specific exonuclease
MHYRWTVVGAQTALREQLAGALGVSPLLVQCLLNRGLTDASQMATYLEPRLKQLSDPFLLPNMEQAVDRLFIAHANLEPLVIFGDYDVDGVTSTAILTQVLEALGWKVSYYLPHRLDEGYGLSQEAVENCLRKHPVSLLLAVDCGSTSGSTIEWLMSRGVETIVLDHHQVSSPLPNALALVNPQIDSEGGARFRNLCSAGLAFKLAHAVVKRGRQMSFPGAVEFDLRPLLDLVALGTIADLVPLTGENRILVSAGLARLNATQRPGLKALMAVARTEGRIGVYEVSFQLAPRLNAAGRLENALQALQLLLATDTTAAENLARALDAQNRERQQIERKIADEVIATLRARFNPETDYVIVEGQLPWHLGVVGIVASRVLRAFYRPTIIMGRDKDEWRGSGRSIEGFDLAAALRSCSDLLTRHGGHAMAAGLSLPAGNLEALRQRLNQIARETLAADSLRPMLQIDTEAKLNELSLGCVAVLDQLEPVGQGNPPVRLVARGLAHQRPPQRVGREQQHVKMWVTDGTATHEALWWGCGEQTLPEGTFEMVFSPEINEFNDRRSVQLKVLDWRAA